MQQEVEFSIIVETYTASEGGDRQRLHAVLKAATEMAKENGRGEVIIADSWGDPQLQNLLADFPYTRVVSTLGLGYDLAKMQAAHEARGRFIFFLDGDCLPTPRWQHHFLKALRRGQAVACGGYTRYQGGFLAAVLSVMDFGFLYPRMERELECYSSNNAAFLKETLLAVPIPSKIMRCHCFYHTQLLRRLGKPVRMVPEAKVLHEMPPLIRERTRQGYDTIAACWADPELAAARWLRWGVLSLPLFYAMNVFLDWRRLWWGSRDLGLPLWQIILSLPLFPLLRLLDLLGMLRAIVSGPEPGGWPGYELGSSPKVFRSVGE